jgi:hypothetical protein
MRIVEVPKWGSYEPEGSEPGEIAATYENLYRLITQKVPELSAWARYWANRYQLSAIDPPERLVLLAQAALDDQSSVELKGGRVLMTISYLGPEAPGAEGELKEKPAKYMYGFYAKEEEHWPHLQILIEDGENSRRLETRENQRGWFSQINQEEPSLLWAGEWDEWLHLTCEWVTKRLPAASQPSLPLSVTVSEDDALELVRETCFLRDRLADYGDDLEVEELKHFIRLLASSSQDPLCELIYQSIQATDTKGWGPFVMETDQAVIQVEEYLYKLEVQFKSDKPDIKLMLGDLEQALLNPPHTDQELREKSREILPLLVGQWRAPGYENRKR